MSLTETLSPLEVLYVRYCRLMSTVYKTPLNGMDANLFTEREEANMVRDYFSRPLSPLGFTPNPENPMLTAMAERHFELQASILPEEMRAALYVPITDREVAYTAHMLKILFSQMNPEIVNASPRMRMRNRVDVVTCFSGGLDSLIATMYDHYERQGQSPVPRLLLHIDYASPYSAKELLLAQSLADHMTGDERFGGGKFSAVSLRRVVKGNEIDESKLIEGYIIPGRNGWLALTAYFLTGAQDILMSAHYRAESGQSVGAIDKNFRFFSELSSIMTASSGARVDLRADTINVSKADTLKWTYDTMSFFYGEEGVLALSKLFDITTSCYHPTLHRCGECSACYKRFQAFRGAGLTDEVFTVDPRNVAARHVDRENRKGR